jgi:hypothetical protein
MQLQTDIGSSYIPATDHQLWFGLHPSNKGRERPAIFYYSDYLDSRGSASLKTSVFRSETELLIRARNFAMLNRDSDSILTPSRSYAFPYYLLCLIFG